MKTLISEVLLPASAAIGLLAMLAIPPAAADEQPLKSPAAATATVAAISAPITSVQHSASAQGETARSSTVSRSAVEPRCERIERIGKFTITRCQ